MKPTAESGRIAELIENLVVIGGAHHAAREAMNDADLAAMAARDAVVITQHALNRAEQELLSLIYEPIRQGQQ